MNCSVAGDLLPLYEQDLVCLETRRLMARHLKACQTCREKRLRLKRLGLTVLKELNADG